MTRRIMAVLLAGVMLFMCAGCAEKSELVSPPFWQATSPDGEVAYLLGSMHAGKKNTIYPDYILDAFDSCGSVICEVDTIAFSADVDEMARCLALLACPEGTAAADYFGDDYKAVKQFFQKNGIYNPMYTGYMPVMWISALSNAVADKCGLSSEYGTENIFLTRAEEQGKRIIEAETALAQYEALALSPAGYDVYTLADVATDGISEQLDGMNELYSAWASFDSDKLGRLLDEEVPAEFAEEYAAYYNVMYPERQQQMAQCLIDADKSQGVFMFVGALHYYADNDIITILENAGWTVEEVRAEMAA